MKRKRALFRYRSSALSMMKNPIFAFPEEAWSFQRFYGGSMELSTLSGGSVRLQPHE
jgi:hypothetical protein